MMKREGWLFRAVASMVVAFCMSGTTYGQLSVAFHADADTAEAMRVNGAPAQQGAIADTSSSSWVNIVAESAGEGYRFSDIALLHPDGSASGATLSGAAGHTSAVENHWAEGNKDHVMMAGWFGFIGEEEFIQIDGIPADYQDGFSVRIFSNRDGGQEPMALHIDGARKVIAPWGAFEGAFRCNVTHVTFDGLKGSSVRIYGNPAGSRGGRRAAINAIQIFKGLPPVAPTEIVGSESPNVYAPGSPIDVHVKFNHPVTLSEEGGATLRLDFDGHEVDAVHAGSLEGDTLRFVAEAPSVTTMDGKVLANSLTLRDGVSLQDGTQKDVGLAHDEFALPNDQISVQRLSVYPHVPGLDQSPHYRFRVRELDSDEWQSPFAFVTGCAERRDQHGQAYWNGLIGGWTQTYCNFELANNVPIEVEITRLDQETGEQKDIRTAVPHPRRKVRSWRVEDGRVYVIFENPALFMVDIDGEMDDWAVPRHPVTRKSYIRFVDDDGNVDDEARHQVAVFANPFILDKPDPSDPDVFVVEPGTRPPDADEGDWTTLYFKPGVHEFFQGEWTEEDLYWIELGRNYYIPGDALVHGNMRTGGGEGALRIYGHGTLTAERIRHALHQEPRLQNRGLSSILRPGGGVGTRIEGITLTDSPDHSLWLGGNFDRRPETWNYARWLKVFTWRANGDGITVDGNAIVEDCFLRLQDDGTYIRARANRRNVYWTDCNGVSLKSNMIMRMDPDHYVDRNFYVEDIDIIYGRHHNPGLTQRHTVIGGHANFRPPVGFDGVPNQGDYIVFRNINFSDPMPFRSLFGFGLRGAPENHMYGMRFENVRATTPFFTGGRPGLWGKSNGIIHDTVMDNVVVGGRQLSSMDDINQNDYVEGTIFKNTEPTTRTFRNHSGYNKWYMRKDWCGEVEPADQDLVKHTALAETLIVDSPAWAGTLDVAHADTASIRLEYSGRLFVSDELRLGDNNGGSGHLQLVDGEVVLRNASADALVLSDGGIHMEHNGLLIWAGDRADDVKGLLDGGHITLGVGRTDIPQASPWDRVRWEMEAALAAEAEEEYEMPGDPQPSMVGRIGEHAIFADYDNINPGFTTFWVAAAE